MPNASHVVKQSPLLLHFITKPTFIHTYGFHANEVLAELSQIP